MSPETIKHNSDMISIYFMTCKNSPEAQEKVNAGKLCLGVQGDRLVVVDYGNSFLSSLIESIKHIFNGVRVGEKAEKVVKEMDAIRGQAFFAKQVAFDNSKTGMIFNGGKFALETVKDFGLKLKAFAGAHGG